MDDTKELAPKKSRGASIARDVTKGGIRTGVGGWLEDKGNKAIDRAIGGALSFAGGTAMSLRSWLAQNWIEAVRISVLAGIGTLLSYKLIRAAVGIWQTTRLLLEALEEREDAASGALGGLQGEMKKLTDQVGALATKAEQTPISLPPLPEQPFPLATTSPLGAMVYAASGSEQRRGIAIIRSFDVSYSRLTALLVESYQLTCEVDFSGLVPGAEMSPASLLVTSRGGQWTIAKLETDGHPPGNGIKKLTADVDRETLGKCLVRPGDGAFDDLNPPQAGTLCDVEIRLPKGEALVMHKASRVALDFELSKEDQLRRFLVPPRDRDVTDGKRTIRVLAVRSPDEPEWDVVTKLEQVELWKAVAWSLGWDAEKLPRARVGEGGLVRIDSNRNWLKERLEIAESSLGGSLPVVEVVKEGGRKLVSIIRLVEFVKWARDEVKWENLPPQLLAMIE